VDAIENNDIVKYLKCKKQFEIAVQEKQLEYATQIYYNCPHCNNYNPVFRTNNKIDELGHDLIDAAENIFKNKNKDVAKSLINKYQKIATDRLSLLKMLNR